MIIFIRYPWFRMLSYVFPKGKVGCANLHTDLPVSVNSKLVKKLVCLELKLRSRTIEFVKSRLHRVIIAPFHSTVEKKMKTILILKFFRVSKKYCCSRFTCKTLLQRVGWGLTYYLEHLSSIWMSVDCNSLSLNLNLTIRVRVSGPFKKVKRLDSSLNLEYDS